MLSVWRMGVSQTTTSPDERCAEWFAPRPLVSSDVSREIHGLCSQGETERNRAEQDRETAHGEAGFMFCWFTFARHALVSQVRIRILLLW